MYFFFTFTGAACALLCVALADSQIAASVLKVIGELVDIAAPVLGIALAVVGLSTWRHQLAGTAAFDSSRRMFDAVYALHGAIMVFRSPMRMVAVQQGETQEQAVARRDSQLFDAVATALARCEAEGSALKFLGFAELESPLVRLRELVQELQLVLLDAHSGMDSEQDARDMRYSTGRPKSVEFGNMVRSAVEQVARSAQRIALHPSPRH